jgi:pimeloyl-ACP methyl ester carboxylesterase
MRSEFIVANGLRFHCLTDGDGPLVLLLHGFPQFSHEYRHLIPALARAGYRAVAPDMRGFGETSRPARIEDYALQTLGDDIAALVDAWGESKAHVLGHEWGGIVAAETALSHPDKVDRLILVNSAPAITLGRAIHHSWRQRVRSSYILFFRTPRLPEWWLTAGHGLFMRLVLPDALSPRDLNAYRDAICQPRAAWAGLAYYRSIARTIQDDADRLRGRRIGAPTLVLWGERDRSLRRDLTNWLDRQATDPPRIIFFPDGGHWIIEERPDEVARAVIGFIDEDRLPGGRPTAGSDEVQASRRASPSASGGDLEQGMARFASNG